MNFLDEINGIQQIGLARTGRAAAHIHAGDRAFAAEDDRTAGQCFLILRVSNFDAAHICDGII